MKLFLDTNIVMDYVENREPFVVYTLSLFQMEYEGLHQLYVSDLTFANIAYLCRKSMTYERLYEVMEELCTVLHIVAIGEQAVTKAIRLKVKDFEDSLQYFSAKHAGVDCIITRNKKDFGFSDIPVYTPSGFMEKFHFNA